MATHSRTCGLLMSIAMIAGVTVGGKQDVEFVQFESHRYHLVGTNMSGKAPWPTLPISEVVSLDSITLSYPTTFNNATNTWKSPTVTPSDIATISLSLDHTVHFLNVEFANATMRPAVAVKVHGILDKPLGVGLYRPATQSAGVTSLVVCNAEGCSWYHCTVHDGSCVVSGKAFKSPLGSEWISVFEVEDDSGAVWLSVEHTAGVIRVRPSTSSTPVADHVTVLDNSRITAVAIHGGDAGRVAVATELAIYYNLNTTNGLAFDSHINAVGASVDGTPSALAFVETSAGEASGNSKVELYIGHEWCLNVVRSDGVTVDRISGPDGLPVSNITVLAAGSTHGSLWIGSQQGLALRCETCDDMWRYFGGNRWLSGDTSNVTTLASPPFIPGDHTSTTLLPAWVSTAASTRVSLADTDIDTDGSGSVGGLAQIVSFSDTLDDKAARYTARIPALSRYRWVAAVELPSYGNNTNADTLLKHDGDNDGLWTGMLVAAQVFRYAVTKSEEARTLAWHHFAAVEFLHNVTNTRGFIARSAVRCGDAHGGGDSGICPSGSPNSCGWVNSSVCYNGVDTDTSKPCCWQWKRDTSSDEVTGHFFTLLVAHEMLATNDHERGRVSRLLCDTATYLLDGKLVFVDPISKKGTSWGYWDPAQLNGVPGKPNERGENSLEVLGFMAAAAKICPQPASARFGKAFASLVREHQYDVNTINTLATSPQSLAFFDFRLAFMSYHNLAMAVPGLLGIEPSKGTTHENSQGVEPFIPLTNKEAMLFRSRLHTSMQRYWNQRGATVDGLNNRVGAMDVVYQLYTTVPGLADADWQLKRYPLELIDWPSSNSQRLDVRLLKDWLTCPGQCQKVVDTVLPADEALTVGSSDFVTEAATNSVDGGGGFVENAPNPWLLLHWMRRWYGMVRV